jgi:hypothetical protein
LFNTFKVRLNESAGATSADPLTVRGVSFAAALEDDDAFVKCVSVLVVCGDNSQLWTQATKGTFVKDAKSDANLYANAGKFNVTDDTGVEVKVYVFFNGLDEACTIANLNAAANNYNVQVNFTVANV